MNLSTIVICVILVIVCILGIRSYVKKLSHGCCGSGGDEVKKVKAQDTDPAHYPYHCTIEVNGMTCSNCKKRVENAFNEQEGYYAVVNLKKKTAEIHMKKEIPENEIKRIILRAGYEPGAVL